MAADLKANHARTKGLQQHLGIGRIVAEIRDDQRIVIVAAIDRRQRAGTRTSKQALRQLFGLADSEQPSPVGRVAADDRGRTIAAAPDIMGNDQGLENGPAVDVIGW